MIDVWVTGSSLTALDAALALAEVGLAVRVSVDEATGGLPLGPEADPTGAIAELVARVGAPLPGDGLGNHHAPGLREIAPTSTLLRGADGALHPLSSSAVLGIPTAPLAAEVIALLGGGGAFRAYMDRLRPVLNIGKERNLGTLVRSRLGAKVERLLVDPIVRERTGAPAVEVDAAMLAPGLNEALSRVGSLSGGALSYGDRNVARETTVEPEGGWAALRAALLARLALYAVELVEDRPVTGLGRTTDGDGWNVRTGAGDAATNERVRAVILDVGALPRGADALGFADDPILTSPATRQYVEVGVQRPSWLPTAENLADLHAVIELSAGAGAGAGAAATAATDTDATAATAATDINAAAETTAGAAAGTTAGTTVGWTARVFPRGDGWVARFSSPRLAAGVTPPRPDVAALCAAAEVVALPGHVGISGDTGGPTARIAVAPIVDVEGDHARLRAIAAFDDAHAGLRPVGESWAGGGLAAALAETMPRVIELRRELLGIA